MRIDAPARATGPQARVLVQYRDGSVASRVVSLNRNGAGDVTVDFGRNSVKKVTAALVNASDRYRAATGTTPSTHAVAVSPPMTTRRSG